VGSTADKKAVRETLTALDNLAEKFQSSQPEEIIISSPHPDWGFNVPLHFLASDFSGKVRAILTDTHSPQQHFQEGQVLSNDLEFSRRYALIASGDLSHRIKDSGPYNFHPDGPRFDQALQEHLAKKELTEILALDSQFPQAGECGLRSFAFALGILQAAKTNWQAKILSYQTPFGVGYLTAQLV
jgi:aromatic ring-opening dioxygenase LigB subunit